MTPSDTSGSGLLQLHDFSLTVHDGEFVVCRVVAQTDKYLEPARTWDHWRPNGTPPR